MGVGVGALDDEGEAVGGTVAMAGVGMGALYDGVVAGGTGAMAGVGINGWTPRLFGASTGGFDGAVAGEDASWNFDAAMAPRPHGTGNIVHLIDSATVEAQSSNAKTAMLLVSIAAIGGEVGMG